MARWNWNRPDQLNPHWLINTISSKLVAVGRAPYLTNSSSGKRRCGKIGCTTWSDSSLPAARQRNRRTSRYRAMVFVMPVVDRVMRLDLQAELLHAAGLRQRIVHFRQYPRADALRADETIQTARPIRRSVNRDWYWPAVVINECSIVWRRRECVAQRIMVVQHIGNVAVVERADEIAKILMRKSGWSR